MAQIVFYSCSDQFKS